MQVSSFTVSSDIVGRRVRISWDFVPGAAETLGSVPPVTLHEHLGTRGDPITRLTREPQGSKAARDPLPGLPSCSHSRCWH